MMEELSRSMNVPADVFCWVCNLSWFLLLSQVPRSSDSTQLSLRRCFQGTMSLGLAHFNTAPTALPHRLQIVVVLDEASFTGQGTRAWITIFRPRAREHTDMNTVVAAGIGAILFSSRLMKICATSSETSVTLKYLQQQFCSLDQEVCLIFSHSICH